MGRLNKNPRNKKEILKKKNTVCVDMYIKGSEKQTEKANGKQNKWKWIERNG